MILLFGLAPVGMAQSSDADKQREPAAGGTLVFPTPVNSSREESGEKNCMTVCARWGEECTYINRGSAGLDKRCRRTCKQFTEECF